MFPKKLLHIKKRFSCQINIVFLRHDNSPQATSHCRWIWTLRIFFHGPLPAVCRCTRSWDTVCTSIPQHWWTEQLHCKGRTGMIFQYIRMVEGSCSQDFLKLWLWLWPRECMRIHHKFTTKQANMLLLLFHGICVNVVIIDHLESRAIQDPLLDFWFVSRFLRPIKGKNPTVQIIWSTSLFQLLKGTFYTLWTSSQCAVGFFRRGNERLCGAKMERENRSPASVRCKTSGGDGINPMEQRSPSPVPQILAFVFYLNFLEQVWVGFWEIRAGWEECEESWSISNAISLSLFLMQIGWRMSYFFRSG